MKKMKLIVLLTFACITASVAQVVKKGASAIATIKTPTVQCEECKNRIEKYLIREEGVTKVNVDYKRKVTKVSYVTDRTTVENIKTAIANAGYDADDVTADN